MEIKDYFISYTSADTVYATWIATILEKNGYRVIIQEWDFRPGDNIPQKIDESLRICKKMIVVMSQKYLESGWCSAEWTNMYYQMIYGNEIRIIPIRIEPILIKGLLGGLQYIDLVDLTKDEAEKRIIEGVKDEVIRIPKGDFPISYSLEHLEINNSYEVYDSYIVYKKTCRSRILIGGKNRIHNRITWFADESVDIESLTEGISVEMIDSHDIDTNFYVVFDHNLSDGEEICFSVKATLTNTNAHFNDFFSTEIITPTKLLSYRIEFQSYEKLDVYTQIIADSPMNAKTEMPKRKCFSNPFVWEVKNPKLHFEYKVFWEKESRE